MMMALGTFVFSLPQLAYQQLQRAAAWRHSSSERVGARAAHQYLGPGEETIELSGLIAPELTGDPASLDTLRDLANQGRPLSLVDGTGAVYGAFAITSINETKTLFFPDGAARRIEFQLSLLRVDDEDMADAADQGAQR
ncbi:phage tail protein [Lysobacter sp. Root604]|uniref:phage tail protein n=1 Tax=Lysobacter sp. Root604 TaxID=1736568 RepID=UPI0006FC15A8|nr:phage tail protein [Lysobacter sp. Root604]KRA15364.1 oxidoreductase [Lysobacter sp. Root604]